MEISGPMTITEVANATELLHAQLMTARASQDPEVVHASIIQAVEGLLACTRAIAAELLKVEIEGVDHASF